MGGLGALDRLGDERLDGTIVHATEGDLGELAGDTFEVGGRQRAAPVVGDADGVVDLVRAGTSETVQLGECALSESAQLGELAFGPVGGVDAPLEPLGDHAQQRGF